MNLVFVTKDIVAAFSGVYPLDRGDTADSFLVKEPLKNELLMYTCMATLS